MYSRNHIRSRRLNRRRRKLTLIESKYMTRSFTLWVLLILVFRVYYETVILLQMRKLFPVPTKWEGIILSCLIKEDIDNVASIGRASSKRDRMKLVHKIGKMVQKDQKSRSKSDYAAVKDLMESIIRWKRLLIFSFTRIWLWLSDIIISFPVMPVVTNPRLIVESASAVRDPAAAAARFAVIAIARTKGRRAHVVPTECRWKTSRSFRFRNGPVKLEVGYISSL